MLTVTDKKPITQEQLQREFNYIVAQQLLESMLEQGLVSITEFNKITALNRQSFSPALARIMSRSC